MSYFVYTMAINFAIKAWELLPKIPVADPASVGDEHHGDIVTASTHYAADDEL